MKILLLVSSLSLLCSSMSQAAPQSNSEAKVETLAICDQNFTAPCQMSQTDADHHFIQMMVENHKGIKLVQKTGRQGLIVSGHKPKVTILERDWSSHRFNSKVKYEIALWDQGGSDLILGAYLWTVTATTDGDGYTHSTQYENNIVKTH